MRNYIILNDQNSNDISGLLIQSLAPISKPLMRTEIEEIDGRDGDITTKLGYSAYDKQITIGLFGNYDVDQVIAFFNSEGTAIFSNEPDKYYNYQIVDQIDFERLVRYKTATVTMHCQPFKYSTTEGADILSSSDNFATLNQSLNTDSSFYTYSSNVQADITATRQSGTGGKFFAVFTVPVVQGVNYHFSGNVSRNVSMYGYTDQLRGTSAGIAGKGFSGNFVYTATFTGTMVLGFYSNATTEIFIRNFAISNEAGSTVSDEGTTLVLEGSGEAPFSQFDLKGNTEQSGTPTPTSPVPVKVVTGYNEIKVCGKNMLVCLDKLHSSVAGLTATLNQDGTITVTGKPTQNYASITDRVDITYILENGQRYTISTDGHDRKILAVVRAVPIGGGSTISYGTADADTTFTVDKSLYTYDLCIMSHTMANWGDDVLTITRAFQLEKASSATSFEPYQSQSYEVNLGKNLFDGSIYKTGYVIASDGSEAAYADAVIGAAIEVEPNTTYTASASWAASAADKYMRVGLYTGDMTYISRSSSSVAGAALTFTTPANARYVRLSYFTPASDVQLEKGSQATSYADYFTPIELCEIGNNQDYIYPNGDSWYVHKVIGKTILPSRDWVFRTDISISGCSAFRYTAYEAGLFATGSQALSSHFRGVQSGNIADTLRLIDLNGYGFNIVINNSAVGIESSDSGTTKQTKFMSWLANNAVSVYYILKTPVDEQITNGLLIEQLNNIADQAHAYKTRTHISSTYATGNVPHIIAAEVIGDASGTVTNSGNIYSKPKLTIFGSGDIGVYLNGVQMFQIALGDSGYITIDTALMEAYQDNLQTLMNRQVTGDYSNFVLNPGDNQISFTGSVSMCVVENYSRWL